MLYGTTYSGGATNSSVPYGPPNGTIFKVNKDGTGYAVLWDFRDPNKGTVPRGGVIQAFDGFLYGTASAGGLYNEGTVFKLNKDSGDCTAVYAFGTHAGDGYGPIEGVSRAEDGYLYGTTRQAAYGYPGPTMFKIRRDGSGYSVLHVFSQTANDFESPIGGLAIGRDGAIYGATLYGGSNNAGSVYRVMTNGTDFALIHSFSTNRPDGKYSEGGLVQSRDGTFYGVTGGGGQFGAGTVYRVWPFPTPDMLSVTVSAGSVSVAFSGAPSFQYRVFRSPDLADWTLLNTTPMPQEGMLTNADNSPLPERAFYRAAWAP